MTARLWILRLQRMPPLQQAQAERIQKLESGKWQATQIPGWRPGRGWKLISVEGNQTLTNYVPDSSSPIVLSPDGKLVVLAGWNAVFALNLPDMTLRWLRKKPGEYERDQWCEHLAVIDKGKSLAVGFTDRVEKWLLLSGETEQLLATNQVPLDGMFEYRALKSSTNGNILAADLGNGVLLVWKSGWTNGPQKLIEPGQPRLLAISPEGRYLAMRAYGRHGPHLVIYDLNNDTQKEMPFRGCFNHDAWKAAWSPDGKFLAVAASGIWTCIYDTTTWKPVVLCRIGDGQSWSGGDCPFLAFAGDGDFVGSTFTIFVARVQTVGFA